MHLRQLFIPVVLIASLALSPAALADDADPSAATPSPAPTSNLDTTSNPLGGVGGVGSASTGDSSTLQPAGTSTLQSGNDSSGNLGGSASQQLQGSTPNESTLQVLGGEIDGAHHDPNAPGVPSWVWLAIAAAIIAAAELVLLSPILKRRWQRLHQSLHRRTNRRHKP